jgi:rubrerythrin
VTYLCNVFASKPEIHAMIRQWGAEEAQHGLALARWAELADPAFDFKAAFKRFQAGYAIPKDMQTSVRGSRAGEMIARCVVESGTSSYYTAIKDATDEPVLKQIAANIAADEFRHYKLFYDTLRAVEDELPSVAGRLRVALGRLGEADDDELACAYYAANTPTDGSVRYDRAAFASAYAKRALSLYRRQHVDRLVAMVGKAVGFKPHGIVMRLLSPAVWVFWRVRTKRLSRAAV